MPELGEIRKGHIANIRSKFIWYACIDCGKERWVRLRWGKPVYLRCSNHNGCHQGFAEHNTNWKADTISQDTGHIRAYRWYPFQPCKVCGKKGEHHHKDGNALNNEPDNIRFLCRKHHMETDGRLEKLKKFHKDKRIVVRI